MANVPIEKNLENEFVGQLIDIFEDFLESKDIMLDNPDRIDEDDAAIIYGSDYDEIEDRIVSTLRNWKLIA